MSANLANPLQQPQSSVTPYEALVFVWNSLMSRVRTAQQVEVMAVHGGGLGPIGTVDVQPLVAQLDGAGNSTPHKTIFGRPYIRWQGGNCAIIMDPQANDIGLLVCCDRDTSNVIATLKSALPASLRKFNFADGVYVSACLSGAAPAHYLKFTPGSGGGISLVTPDTLMLQGENVDITGAVDANGATIDTSGNIAAPTMKPANGATGTFTAVGGITVTVQNGIITSIS